MKNRLLKILLIVVLLFQIIPVASADPTEDLQWSVESRIRNIDVELGRSYSGQVGLLRKLQYLTAKVMWVEFSEDPIESHGTNFNKVYRLEMRDSLRRDIVAFNALFSQKDKSFKPISIPVWKEDAQDVTEQYQEILGSTVPIYIKEVLKPILDEYNASTDDATKTKIVKDNRDLLRYSYRVLDTMISIRDEMAILSQGLLNVTDSQLARDLFSSGSEYNVLLQRGREVDINMTSVGGSGIVDEEGELIQKLTSVQLKQDTSLKDLYGEDMWQSTTTSDGSFTLKDVYLKMLATSAVYRPFVSKAGSEEFSTALGSLYGDAVNSKLATDLYYSIYNNKKPLYKTTKTGFDGWANYTKDNLNGRTTSNSDKYLNEANLITLGDFLDLIEKSNYFGLVTKKGQMKENAEDMNAFSFYTDNKSEDHKIEIVSKGSDKDTGPVWTAPIMLFNSDAKNTKDVTGYTTATILRHAVSGIADIKSLKKSNEFLFMNALGDIVLQDNTIILPAIANPIVYKNLDLQSYYPYSVSFLSSYPDISVTDEETALKLFEGRYIFADLDKRANYLTAIRIKSQNRLDVSSAYPIAKFRRNLSEPIGSVTTSFGSEKIGDVFKNNFFARMLDHASVDWKKKMQTFAENPSYNYNADSYIYTSELVYFEELLVSSANRSISLFRYDPTLDTDYSGAKYIARNMYSSFTTGDEGENVPITEYIDHDYIFRNILLEGLNGTLYADSYSKNIATNATLKGEDMSFFNNIMYWLIDESLPLVGDTQGLLGMKDFREDKLFGPVLNFVDEYLILLAVGIMILFLVKYIRQKERLIVICISLVLSIGSSIIFVKWVPTYVPQVFNIISNNLNDKLGYDILSLKTERYDRTYVTSGLSEDGSSFDINGTTLTLYRFTDSQLRSFEEANNIKPGSANGGSIYMLDSANGLFFEGNRIKVSTDLLFRNHPVQGQWVETPDRYVYIVKAYKTQSSVVDYYTPYTSIMDNFIYSLNGLSQVYNIPHNRLTYLSGLQKDSFMVSSFINSAPFLSPAKYDVDSYGLTPEEIGLLEYYFDNDEFLTNSYDFLNLNRMLTDVSSSTKETLWYQTMQRNGIFDSEEAYWDVVESTNLATKKFMIELGKESYLMSDENLIKVISLFAANEFNRQISDFNMNVYPQALNYQDFFTQDVYLATLTNEITKFVSEDMSLSTLIVNQGHFVGSILLFVDMWLSYFVKIIMDVLVMFIFLLFSILIIVKLSLGGSVDGLIKGASKLSGLVLVVGALFYLSFAIADKMSIITACLVLLLIHAFCIYVLFIMVTAVLANITEMGNGKFKAQLDNINNSLGINKLVSKIIPGIGRSGTAHVSADRIENLYKLDYKYGERVWDTTNGIPLPKGTKRKGKDDEYSLSKTLPSNYSDIK